MLQRTFIHTPGLGSFTERSLWRQGCHSWQHYLDAPDEFNVSSTSRDTLRRNLEASCSALAEKRHQFFSQSLGARETWRAWREFRRSCIYLDIETDGSNDPSCITCIGLYDGSAFRCLIKDEDLSYFPDIVSHYSTVVSFFGSGFDIPVLRRAFPGFHFDHIHVDLCHVMKQLGFRGGLKKIETQFGIERSEATVGLTGRDAICLWRNYLRGDMRSLDLLVEYNREDVVNLEKLMDMSFRRLEHQLLTEAGVGHLAEPIESLV